VTDATTGAGVPLDASTGGPVRSLLDRVVGDSGDSSSAPAGGGADTPPRVRRSRTIPLLTGGGLSRVLSGWARPAAPAPAVTSEVQTPSALQVPAPANPSTATSATGVSTSSDAAAASTATGGTVRSTVRQTITSTTTAVTGLGG
jgi:hypothetical protein